MFFWGGTKMKKKLLGIFVCMLLIATALPAVGTMNDDEINLVETPVDSDIRMSENLNTGGPIWHIGPICWLPDCDWNYWDDSDIIYTHELTDKVGIGMDNPAAKLDLEGDWVQFKNSDGPVSLHLTALQGNVASLHFYETNAGPQGTVKYHPAYNALMLETSGDPVKHILIMPRNNVGIGATNPTTKLHVNGPVATAITTVATDYDITSSDSVILGNGVDIHVKLPKADTCPGREYTIKKINADSFGAVSVDCHYTSPSEFDLLDNCFNTHALNTRNDYIVVVSDGVSNWYVVGMGPGFC